MIPAVIIHIGYKEYLKVNLEITGMNNKIYLIGDNSVKNMEHLKNVTYVDINKYRNISIIRNARESFINYSSNNKDLEWICFERIFILKFFMEEYNINHIFHIDSDNILLHNINNYPFKKNIAYCLCKNYHTFRMSNSVHCGLLNQIFCDKFIELYNDLYINKSKYNLIEDKINYHTTSNGSYINGGICDMTLYYILAYEKIIDVQNLLEPNNNIVFLNNINNGEGYEYKQQYRLKNNIVDISFNQDQCNIYDEINNNSLMIYNIHFQGGAKRFMKEELKRKIPKHIIKMGTDYGGWQVPSFMKLDKNSIIYSGGVGQDISFDLLLQNKYKCNIILIDPTEKAIRHFNEIKKYYINKELFSKGIQKDYYSCIESLDPNFNKITYLSIGLWKIKDNLKFYKQTNEDYVSQSLVENIFGQNYDIVPVDSIKNIMEQQGHSHIDLLKLDIEGAEIETINQMLDDKIYPTYVLIEFDLLLKNKDPNNTTKQLIERMITKEHYNILKNDKFNITFVRY